MLQHGVNCRSSYRTVGLLPRSFAARCVELHTGQFMREDFPISGRFNSGRRPTARFCTESTAIDSAAGGCNQF